MKPRSHRTIRTMCPMNCHPTLCGMLVDLEDDRVIRVRGDKENPDSHGFLCVRGQASHEIIYLMEQALPPPGGTRPLSQVLSSLAEHLQLDGFFPWDSQEALLNAILDHPSTGHATVAALRKGGVFLRATANAGTAALAGVRAAGVICVSADVVSGADAYPFPQFL